jgi:hypothetical protein
VRVGLILLLILVVPAWGQDLAPVPNYRSITGEQRLKWFVVSTVGPRSLLLDGPLSAGLSTAVNSPSEYGPHWDGFADRYGMRLTGISTGNAMEAGLGAIWGEDPRYFRSRGLSFGSRVKYVLKTAWLAPDRRGHWHPAYARYAGNIGNNFLSNTWRVPSASTNGQAARRCLYGASGNLAGDALREFWPDIHRKLFHR